MIWVSWLVGKVSALLLAAQLTLGGGLAISFDAFFWSLTQQESGGNYGAVGPSVQGGHHAYGRYQVMDYNIPSWTKQYYGKSLTPQQFLNNKAAQDAVARGKLQSYVNKYGFEGAAAMWYSGQSDPSKTYGNPPVYKYVNDIMDRATTYKGGSTTSSSKVSSSSVEEEKPLAANELAEQYGFVDALFDSNPELKKLFDRAVKGQWTADKFQAELRDTKWWKTHSESERKYLTQRYGDPATAKQDLAQAFIQVRQLANQMGMVETPALLKKMNTWAYNVAAKGWSESQLRYELGKYVSFGGDKWQGEGGEAIEALHSYAYSMGITMSDKFYTNGARAIIRGVAKQQDYEDQIRRQAKATYAQWSKQIDAGQTVADLASPYMQSMAQILELPSGSVNLFDNTIKKALQYKNATTGKSEIKALWQFENELRNDPRWRKTKNAQDSLMQVAHQVLADFGFKY